MLSKDELRRLKPRREAFAATPRLPIVVVLDGVRQAYNIGAIFRLCDAMLIERLVVTGTHVDLRKRRLAQAAQGSQHWVPWAQPRSALEAVLEARRDGRQIVIVELTSNGVPPEAFVPKFPLCVVLGAEFDGVSQEVADVADAAIAIPMRGMANSISVATAAAIALYRLARQAEAPAAPLSAPQ